LKLSCLVVKPVKKLGNYGYSEEAEAVVHGDIVRAPPVPYSGTSRWAFCFLGCLWDLTWFMNRLLYLNREFGVDALLRTMGKTVRLGDLLWMRLCFSKVGGSVLSCVVAYF